MAQWRHGLGGLRCFVVLGALVALPTDTRAQATQEELSGNKLHAWCQGADVEACESEIDEYGFAYAGEHCVPDAATFQQIVDVIKLYLVNRPERRHLPAWQLIGEAVDQAWPCE